MVNRHKFLIILTVALVTAAALALSALQTPLYRSTAEVLLKDRPSEEILAPGQGPQDLTIVDTEIEVMRSGSVAGAVRKALGFEPAVSISGKGETYVVAITATSTEPAEAARIANTYAETYVETRRRAQISDLLSASEQVQSQLRNLEKSTTALDAELAEVDANIASARDEDERLSLRARRDRLVADQQADRASIDNRRATYLAQLDQLRLSSELTKTGGAQIVSKAVPAGSPFKPTPARNLAVAIVLGLLMGVGLAFLRDYLDDSIGSREDLDRAMPGVDLLALVPQYGDWKDRHIATIASTAAPQSGTAEAYRTLRTSMQFMGIDRPVKITQITSPNPGEGKSTTLANLAVQLSRAGKRVIAVDCDLRRPRLHQFFGIDNSVGFTSVLVKSADLADAVIAVETERSLMVVPSGPVPPNPSELLSTKRTQDVLQHLSEQADFVLVDSPPVLPVSDALVLSGVVDATIVVLAASSTTKRDLHRAYELLEQVDAPVIGAVFNSVEGSARYDDSYGTYGDFYGPSTATKSSSSLGRRPWRRKPREDDPEAVAAGVP